MRWAFRIGRVAGTDIKVHVTFLLLLAWLGYAGYADGGTAVAVMRVLGVLALFACVVLHEFGHITMARQFGVRTPDVLVLPIGGVARLERIPEEPKQEFLIAIAGPSVTLAIVVVLYLLLRVTGGLPASGALHAGDAFLPFLMKSNLLLFFFNLAPAFPMDGGRVLRAALSSRLGLVKGTRIAARLGQFFAVTGGIYAYNKGEPILVLIAFFIFLSAGSEAVA